MDNCTTSELIFVDIPLRQSTWRYFLDALLIPQKFLTQEEFIRQFPNYKNTQTPAVYTLASSTLTQLLSAQHIKAHKSLPEFLKLVNQTLYTRLGHDEIYDILDEQNNFISMATWKVAHSQGLRHQTAAILLFKDTSFNKVLIQQRAFHDGQDPGLWNHSAGGHVLAAQTPEQTIVDELQEELFFNKKLPQININKITTIDIIDDIPGNNELLHLYHGVYNGPFFPDPHEVHDQPQWINWKTLMHELKTQPNKYSNASRIIFKKYHKIKNVLDKNT